MKNNITIGARLGSGFGFLLLIVVVIVCFSISETRKLNDSVKDIAKGSHAKTVYAFQASKALDDVISSIKMVALLKDEKAIAAEKQKIVDARVHYKEAMAKLEETEQSEEGKKLLENMKTSVAPAAEVDNKVMDLALAHKQDEAVDLFMKKSIPLLAKLQEAFNAQVTFQQKNVEATYQKSEEIFAGY